MRSFRKLPCRICKRGEPEVSFRPRLRYCISCESAKTRVCKVCGQEKDIGNFYQPGTRKNQFTRPFCNKCRYAADAEGNKRRARERYFKLKERVFNAYGGYQCACCGETDPASLELDHINEDGAEHRRSLTTNWSGWWINKNVAGLHIFRDLVKRNFPPGFQVLCSKCNQSKRRNGTCKCTVRKGATTIPTGSRLQAILVAEAPSLRPAENDMVYSTLRRVAALRDGAS
jgi:hypothetical protein